MGGEAELALVQITGTPSKGDVTKKGEPKTVRSAQPWFYDSQVIKPLMKDKDPPLQPVIPTQILLNRYGLGDTSKGGFRSGLSMKKERSDGM